ncbi:serine/threonine protein kinase [Phormidium tenue FACHB-886]|nr:serine/threonine protein kinase [Phormidium tenue FACHB-886]
MPKRSHYRFLGLVGQGQFGLVFCAVHRQTGRLAALKSLDPQRFSTHKFLRELRFLLSLRHPNIVGCQAIEHTATGRHLVMDYCEGGTLRSLIKEEVRLSLSQSVQLIVHVLEGLAHAHDRGIVHCDIKPENILLKVQPMGWTAQISDFGIARLNQAIEGREVGNTGSPAYMAPERFYGEYSPTSDLYSVGVMLYEMLAGYRPFAGSPAELMSAHLNHPVSLPASIPVAWQPVIVTALQKLSARRFQSAEEMLLAIRAIPLKEAPPNTPAEASRKRPLLLATAEPPDCLFKFEAQQPLAQPVTDVVVSGRTLYQAQAQRVVCSHYPAGFLAPEALSSTVLEVPALEALWLRPQGCFAATRRSLHLISASGATYQTLLELEQDSIIAIAPGGSWVAVLTPTEQSRSYQLDFKRLNDRPIALAGTALELVFKEAFSEAPRLLALDERHVAVVLDLPRTRFTTQGGTLIKVLTRRGDEIGSLLLPLPLKGLTFTATPYQLLAIDRNHPELLTLINLKPYRITRLVAGILPDFLAIVDWGYIVANQQGEVALLDLEGRQVGLMQMPVGVTAITPFEQHGLLVATWAAGQGSQYAIDLREIGADLLF